MRWRRGVGLAAVCASTFAAFAFANGCGGGDDSSGDTGGDSSTGADGTTTGDGASPGDSGQSDAGVDAAPPPPPHLVFVTSLSFTGDLVTEAAAYATDAGLDAGTASAPDGGEYAVAADFLCNRVAAAAGRPGTYTALVTAGTDTMASRIPDEGAWALVDGTPVADSKAELVAGRLRSSIDVDEKGVKRPFDNGFVWSAGGTSVDCNAWKSAAATGHAGTYGTTGYAAFNNVTSPCTSTYPLYCAQVGPGAGPNRYPAIPAGGKLAFVAAGSYPGGFALSDAGVLDASAPDAGDAVHSVADEICNELARGAGHAGSFHAWVSSSGADAKTYFMSHSMNGPWFRPDGLSVAASLSALTTNGTATQIEVLLDGGIALNVGDVVRSGTNLDGTKTVNCQDFTSSSSGDQARNGRSNEKNVDWADRNAFPCDITAGLYCFEE